MDTLYIKELKRKLTTNKDKFMKNLKDVFFVLGINGNGEKYLNEYESICDEMIEYGTQYKLLEDKMDYLNSKFDKLKGSLIKREDINLIEKLDGIGNRRIEVIDGLYQSGFISSEKCEELKEHFWNNRYRKRFSD